MLQFKYQQFQVIALKRQLQIRIFPDGKIEGKTLGIQGKKCTDYISILEQMLKARAIESAYTDEYYQSEIQEQGENAAIEQQVAGKVQS